MKEEARNCESIPQIKQKPQRMDPIPYNTMVSARDVVLPGNTMYRVLE
jgi:hypothetical protein